MSPLDHFLRGCADEIGRRARLAHHRRAELDAGWRTFIDALDGATPREREPASVPLTDCFDRLADAPLVASFLAARPEISWIPSPRTRDGGVDRALAPINDVRELGDVVCGLMLIGPGRDYPEHAHVPQEIYLPIAGSGRWRYGGNPDYRDLDDDTLVYNPPRVRHAARAGDDPLLAIYVLWK